MACRLKLLMCAWQNEENDYKIGKRVCVHAMCVCIKCGYVSRWRIMFASLFSNTVMDNGTFARFGSVPLAYHLRARC